MKFLFIAAWLKKQVNIGTDCSIRPENDEHAIEIRVLVKESELETVLPRIFDVMENAGMSANTSCGTHVHLDMRNRNPELAYSNLFKAQGLMLASQPKARRTNYYCKKNTRSELSKSEFDSGERYSVINTQAYSKLKTIEIRLHAGTVKYEDMKSWIEFLVAIVSKTDKLKSTIDKVEDLGVLGLSESSLKHITKRIKKYA